MKHILIFIIGMMALAACGSAPYGEDIYSVDPAFYTHVSNFERLYGSTLNNIVIMFGPMEGKEANVVGYCRTANQEARYVVVLESWWNSSSSLEQEALLFHELGHCVLNRDHLTEKLDNGMPRSIMNETIVPEYWYERYRGYYYKELFNR